MPLQLMIRKRSVNFLKNHLKTASFFVADPILFHTVLKYMVFSWSNFSSQPSGRPKTISLILSLK